MSETLQARLDNALSAIEFDMAMHSEQPPRLVIAHLQAHWHGDSLAKARNGDEPPDAGNHHEPALGAEERAFFRALTAEQQRAYNELKETLRTMTPEQWSRFDPRVIDPIIDKWKQAALILLAPQAMRTYLVGQLLAGQTMGTAQHLPMSEQDKRAISYLQHYYFNEIDARFEHLKSDLRRHLISGMQEGRHPTEVGRLIGRELKDYTTWWDVIAITETARAQTQGRLQEYVDEGLGQVQFSTANDPRVCPTCKSFEGKVIRVADVQGKSNYGRAREDWLPVPPVHPRCRCVLLPYKPGDIMERIGKQYEEGKTYQIGDAAIVLHNRGQDDYQDGSPPGRLIHNISVPPEKRGRGAATAAMHALTGWADKTQTHLYAEPSPFDDKPMDEGQLTNFYGKHGFQPYTPGTMIRKPQMVKVVDAEGHRHDDLGRFATTSGGAAVAERESPPLPESAQLTLKQIVLGGVTNDKPGSVALNVAANRVQGYSDKFQLPKVVGDKLKEMLADAAEKKETRAYHKQMTEQVRALHEHTKAEWDKLYPDGRTLFRGVDTATGDRLMAAYRKGENVFNMRPVVSTSSSLGVAMRFGRQGAEKHNIPTLVQIEGVHGDRVIGSTDLPSVQDVYKDSAYEWEDETSLFGGSNWQITDIERRKYATEAGEEWVRVFTIKPHSYGKSIGRLFVKVMDLDAVLGHADTSTDLAVHVPASAGEGKDRYSIQNVKQPSGAPVRGTPIAWNDERIPENVYHVTTRADLVGKDHKLKAGGVGGLGGDKHDSIVSFTTDPKIAENLERDMKMMSNVSRAVGPEPEYRTPERTAWGRKLVGHLHDESQKQGWDYKSKLGRYDDDHIYSSYNLSDWQTHFFNHRPESQGKNPIFFGVKQDYWAGLDPSAIQTIKVPRKHLNTGSLVTDFDLGQNNLEEVRHYGDVAIPSRLMPDAPKEPKAA